MAVEIGVELTVYADRDYRYVIGDGAIMYKEKRTNGNDLTVEIVFGSDDEMEATARAMLRFVEIKREGL